MDRSSVDSLLGLIVHLSILSTNQLTACKISHRLFQKDEEVIWPMASLKGIKNKYERSVILSLEFFISLFSFTILFYFYIIIDYKFKIFSNDSSVSWISYSYSSYYWLKSRSRKGLFLSFYLIFLIISGLLLKIRKGRTGLH